MADITDKEMREDLRTLSEQDPQAGSLVGQLLLHSAQERERIEQSVIDSLTQQLERETARADRAERRIFMAQERMMSIFNVWDDDGAPTV